MKKYILFIFMMLFITGCNKYDVMLSEIRFDHDADIDIITYIAENPTNESLACELLIKLKGKDSITDTFELEPMEIKEMSTRAKLPLGETQIVMQTRCKPK